jgi:hypothetical protein
MFKASLKHVLGVLPVAVLVGGGFAFSSVAAERPPMPAVTQPVMFNTPKADKILAALQVFPPDNPWNEDISKRPVHLRHNLLGAALPVHGM